MSHYLTERQNQDGILFLFGNPIGMKLNLKLTVY